jgi:predicted GNAT superfamily acetyltransferase
VTAHGTAAGSGPRTRSAADPAAAAGVTTAQAAAADAAALRTATRAGVRIRELSELADLKSMCQLFDTIWAPGPGSTPQLRPDLLRALTKAGNYASGAYDVATGRLIGACMGFFGAPAEASLHSHIAGVSSAGLGRAVGLALKAHQRAWCLRQGVTTMHWTFDPLIRRNAYFNLVKLGARPTEYLPNFYGEMNDSINGATETDRMLIHWDLRSDLAAAACDGRPAPASAAVELDRGAMVALGMGAGGEPVPGPFGTRAEGPGGTAGGVALVRVPADAEELRGSDPALAAAWRGALRAALAPLMDNGARVTGFDRDGWYVVSTGSAEG